ncbi:MAG: DNA-binding transcriptional MerR regulator [Candidatus Saccharimonadales bacterium]|jgi:DNA-binding transcriptional MerR regulator
MFSIGEFSRVARVSKRLLRYYDEIGLFTPVRTDSSSGYRYYGSTQIVELNRIIALKEMGLSLEEIQKATDDNISEKELRLLLVIKKSEMERSVDEQMSGIKRIQSRIDSFSGHAPKYEVVTKDLEAMEYLNFQGEFPNVEAGKQAMAALIESVGPASGEIGRILFIAQMDGFEFEGIKTKLGYVLNTKLTKKYSVTIGKSKVPLAIEHVPSVELAATLVFKGSMDEAHSAYSALGLWIDANGYHITGNWRDLFLERPKSFDDVILEIQVPIKRI